MPIAEVGFEVQIAPPQAPSSPQQAASTKVISANPAEILPAAFADIGMLAVVDEEMLRRLAERVVPALNRIVARVELGLTASAILELPRLEPFGDVVLPMLHVPPALDHQRAQPALAELLGGEAAGDPRADNDRVVRLIPLW